MKVFVPAPAVRPAVLGACILLAVACDDETEKKKHEVENQQQLQIQNLQVQIEEERAQRRRAEQAASAAEQSTNTKIISIVCAGCVVSILAGIAGIVIGPRAQRHSVREAEDGK
jgi:hypothetical protein